MSGCLLPAPPACGSLGPILDLGLFLSNLRTCDQEQPPRLVCSPGVCVPGLGILLPGTTYNNYQVRQIGDRDTPCANEGMAAPCLWMCGLYIWI